MDEGSGIRVEIIQATCEKTTLAAWPDSVGTRVSENVNLGNLGMLMTANSCARVWVPLGSVLGFNWSDRSLHLGPLAGIRRSRSSTVRGCAECGAIRRELRCPPTDRHGGTLADPACVHLARYAGTAHLPGTDLPLHSSAGPGPLSRAANVGTVAGRLAPSAEHPADTEGLVSPCLSAKRPSRPLASDPASGDWLRGRDCGRPARGSAVHSEPEISLVLRKISKFQPIRLTGLSSVLL